METSFPAPFVREAIFCLVDVFGHFIKDQVTEFACGCVRIFCSIDPQDWVCFLFLFSFAFFQSYAVFCSIISYLGLWCSLNCLWCTDLPLLLYVSFCSKWILVVFSLDLWGVLMVFWLGFHQICVRVLRVWTLHNVSPCFPRTMDSLPFSDILFHLPF